MFDWTDIGKVFPFIPLFSTQVLTFVIFTGICQAILFFDNIFMIVFFQIGKMEKGCLKKLKQTN